MEEAYDVYLVEYVTFGTYGTIEGPLDWDISSLVVFFDRMRELFDG